MEINKIGIDLSGIERKQETNNKSPESVDSIMLPDKKNDKALKIEDVVDVKEKFNIEDETTKESKEVEKAELPEMDMVVNKAYFAVDDKAKQIVIKIINPDGEVIKQIPPEDYVELSEKIKDRVENLFSISV